jgi:YfiR/HmsC-like
MGVLRSLAACLVAALLLCGNVHAAVGEYQVKAVFLFNFSRFVDWPESAFPTPDAPFVIGVFGHDPFGSELDDATRGETVNGRPLVVRRVHDAVEAAACQILFVHRSEAAHMDEILATLDHRSTLTVSDLEEAGQRGAMIALVTENNRIRLRVNVDSARAAHLVISSKLLRSAEIIESPTEGK